MKSINFDTGVRCYAINGDESNFISININDINLFARIQRAKEIFDPILARLDTEEITPELYCDVDAEIKEKLDYIFAADLSSHVFGSVNCLSPLEDGRLLFVSFFEAFSQVVLDDINKSREESAKKKAEQISRYLPSGEAGATDAPVSLDSLNEEQLAYLRSLKK